jgi:hypothetical protein
MRQFFLVVFLLTNLISALAQEDETPAEKSSPSPDTASIFYSTINDRWSGEHLTRLNDTILNEFNYFHPTESMSKLNALAGNIGLAYRSLVFSLPEYSGFRYTPFNFLEYKWSNRTIRYFHTTGPYTNVFYSTGPGKEQLFNVTHSQNILGGLTLGVDLRIVNSVGLYERQKSDNLSFAGTVQYVTKSENYVVLGNYHSSTFKWRENGGISNEGTILNNIETDRKRVPIYLLAADNLLKDRGVQIRQFYYFAKAGINISVDSLKGDTIGPKKLHRYYNPYRSNFIRHTFSYSKNNDIYTDKNPFSGFYQNVLKDSTSTYDYILYDELKNDISIEAGVGRAKGSAKALMLRIGIEHVAGTTSSDTVTKNNFSYLTPYASLSANAFGLTRVEGKIWTVQGNPFNGDKGIEGNMMIPGYDNSERWGNLKVSALLLIEQPFYFYQIHKSNHFSWDNAFGQQTTLALKAFYDYRFLKAGFNAFNLNDYVYLNRKAIPAKLEESVSISQIWASADVRWRNIESQFYGVFQNSTNSEVISLPVFAGRMSLYYSRALFKRALQFQGGLTALYNTAYYPDAYMPSLRAFYVQGYRETGNYPYVDAFINIRVKRARMFLIMKHVNGGLMGYDYFMVPGYPMPDRGIRFGVSWTFYD